MTIILVFIVFGGVNIINKVAPAFLVPVLLSLICIFVGILLARRDNPGMVLSFVENPRFDNKYMYLTIHFFDKLRESLG